MLRLPPTTIALTMTEVRDFDDTRLRFKRYLARHDDRIRFPAQVASTSPSSPSEPDDLESLNIAGMTLDTSEGPPSCVETDASKHLSLAPDQPTIPARRSSMRDSPTQLRSSQQNWTERTRLLLSAVRFVDDVIRATSPSRGSLSSRGTRSASETPSLDQGGWDRPEHPTGPSLGTDSQFRIYDDSLPATSQPQTPQHVPEARHQSRLGGSYTAPVQRVAPRSAYRPGLAQGRQFRATSPTGLDTPGFRGLYGGLENSDDSVLFQDASRFYEDDLRDREG